MSVVAREPEPSAVAGAAALRALVERRFAASMEVPQRFFEAQADAVSAACLDMARRFHRGGRLLVFGDGAAASDAQHVMVEFVHPVLVGKRALPAIALAGDAAGAGGADGIARQLAVLGGREDIALGIGFASPAVRTALARAAALGMLTIALGDERDTALLAETMPPVHHGFLVPATDPLVVQEVQETLYHVLWELVHVFFEHGVVA